MNTLPKHLVCSLLSGLLVAVVCCRAQGQASLLDRRIDLVIENATQQEALDVVARQAGFEWSYNTKLLDANKRVSLKKQHVSVREALTCILGSGYEFKAGQGYMTLRKHRRTDERLSGYLTDARTGQRVAGATVYDRRTLRTTTTDSNGYYELAVGKKAEVVIAKLDFRDTVLSITSETPHPPSLDLVMTPVPVRSSPWLDFDRVLLDSDVGKFFLKTAQQMSTLNVQNSMQRNWQVSLLPKLGTNRGMSGHVVNDWSLNVLAGYSLANRKMEVAGIGNITRRHLQGVQLAGVFNELRGSSDGVQVASLWNRVGDTLRGVQVAGAFNFARRAPAMALQLTAGMNILAKGQAPLQVSGIVNWADTLRGLQVSGIQNYARVLRSVQVSGLWAQARTGRSGVQVAGVYNAMQRGRVNVQVAGLSNWADTLAGVQVTGISNRAGVLRGVQVGLINRAEEVQGGLQLGLLNTSHKGGYRVWEVSANEVTWVNLSFKSGVRGFYTHFTGGFRPDSAQQKLWVMGFGVGSRAGLTRWLGLSFDLTQRHVSVGKFSKDMQGWTQGALCVDLPIGKHLSLAFGPTANVLVAPPGSTASAQLREQVLPGAHLRHTPVDSRGWWSGWVGGSAALRIRW